MNVVKERLAEIVVEIAIAREAREAKKKQRRGLRRRRAYTSNIDRELETMKAGIVASKKERDALVTQLIDDADE